MTDLWHGSLRHVRAGELTGDTDQTTGMTRLEAVSGRTVGSRKVWMGETRVAPATNSGDHHHGEAETAIYVVSGRPVFVQFDEHPDDLADGRGRRLTWNGHRAKRCSP